ncbi:MAG: hypothetical protein HQK78_12730, partial [Desulfobacterales bacterium]|nr:hypothetical protein [Desulfobacterales bacterium]
QKFFVRAEFDNFTVSLDSSGDPLYKRGIKKQKADAPIRETTAAAILKIAGYDGQEPLIDPMCGSGTFSIEAAMISQNICSGIYRDFSFMDWPCFSEKRWLYIKNEAKKKIKINEPTIFASDKDEEICTSFKDTIKNYDIFKTIKISSINFFDLNPNDFSVETGLVVINPPYGLRLESSNRILEEIFKKIIKDYKNWKFAVIVPNMNFKLPLKKFNSYKINHGGLNLILLTGKA